MKHIKIFLSVILIFVIVAGVCFKTGEYTQTEFMMDTFITITAYGKNAKEATEKAIEKISELDKKFSAYSNASEIFKINSQTQTKNIDTEVYEVIKKATEFSKMTDGAFDITLKPVSDIWQFGTGSESVPKSFELEDALMKKGAENIVFFDEDKSITFLKEGMQIDLGGVIKGYAAQEAANVLKENGIENAYLDLGGNISVIGKKPLGLLESIKNGKRYRDFIVGIQDPEKSRGEIIDTVTGDNNYIVTSGAYERNFIEDGKLYHHIIDGKTGYPAEITADSVTVISKDGMAADMISTALFVLGKDEIEKIPDNLYDEIIFAYDGKTERIKSTND